MIKITGKRRNHSLERMPGASPQRMGLCLLLVFAVAVTPFQAYADATPMSSVLCEILNLLMGKAGKAMGTLGIAVIGVAAVMGKASWGLAITVGTGIGVMFGCREIVYTLGLGSVNCTVWDDYSGYYSQNFLLDTVLHYFA